MVSAALLLTGCVHSVRLESAEKITLNDEHMGKSIHIEITDEEDVAHLINICQGTAVFDFSRPFCGFGAVELIFESNNEKISIYPAYDSCGSMCLGQEDKFSYDISEEKRACLVSIWEKYGATFPCV